MNKQQTQHFLWLTQNSSDVPKTDTLHNMVEIKIVMYAVICRGCLKVEEQILQLLMY
jgi:hypothetical protein